MVLKNMHLFCSCIWGFPRGSLMYSRLSWVALIILIGFGWLAWGKCFFMCCQRYKTCTHDGSKAFQDCICTMSTNRPLAKANYMAKPLVKEQEALSPHPSMGEHYKVTQEKIWISDAINGREWRTVTITPSTTVISSHSLNR